MRILRGRGDRTDGGTQLNAAGPDLEEHLDDLRRMKRPVVLIAGPTSKRDLPRWRAAFEYRLHVLADLRARPELEESGAVQAATNDEIAAYLRSVGPVAAVVDEQATTLVEQLQRWQRSFFHIAAEGSFISLRTEERSPWAAALESLGSRRIGAGEVEELQDSLTRTWDSDGRTISAKQRDHLVKVRHEDALELLPGRLGAQNVRVLGSRRAATVKDQPIVRSTGSDVAHKLPAFPMQAPELSLLEVRGGTTLGPAMLAVTGSTVLPSSFKHPWRAWNDELRNVSEQIALPMTESRPETPRLDGVFFDLTAPEPGDRAQFLSVSLSKLWGWAEAKRREPALRALYRTSPEDPEAVFQRDVLHAFGIVPEDVHMVDCDVVVERLVIASQSWQDGGHHYAHPVNAETWAAIRRGLGVDGDGPDRVFLTRHDSNGTPLPRNAAEVMARFGALGFTIVNLDSATASEVARTLRGARTVAGFSGGALHASLFAADPEHIVVVTHDSNTSRSEHLFATLLATEIDYLWSRPDVAQPKDKFSSAAFRSAWDVDLRANATALDALRR